MMLVRAISAERMFSSAELRLCSMQTIRRSTIRAASLWWEISQALNAIAARCSFSNNLNFAPRIAFAWSPGAAAGRQPKTVIRGGSGVFYERAAENLTLQSNRFNGINQQQFTVTDPDVLGVFPRVPPIESLAPFARSQNTYRIASDLTA